MLKVIRLAVFSSCFAFYSLPSMAVYPMDFSGSPMNAALPSTGYMPNFSGAPTDNNVSEIGAIMSRIQQLQGFMNSTASSANLGLANSSMPGTAWPGSLNTQFGSTGFSNMQCQQVASGNFSQMQQMPMCGMQNLNAPFVQSAGF